MNWLHGLSSLISPIHKNLKVKINIFIMLQIHIKTKSSVKSTDNLAVCLYN